MHRLAKEDLINNVLTNKPVGRNYEKDRDRDGWMDRVKNDLLGLMNHEE